MSSMGRRLLSALIESEDDDKFQLVKDCGGMFREGELELYEYVSDFNSVFGKIPNKSTVMDKLGDVLVEAPEPIEYYASEVEKRYIHTKLKEGMISVNELLVQKKIGDALDKMAEITSYLTMVECRKQVMDYREVESLVMDDFFSLKHGLEMDILKFGYPTLDNMTGGGRAGDFISIVGRPSLGKTMMMLCIARKHWLLGGKPIFISMEMPIIQISQRLISMDAQLPLLRVTRGELTSVGEKKLVSQFEENRLQEQPFWLVDGDMTANVDDIYMLCKQLHPTVVFVDGAYLLRNKNSKLSRWDRITDNAELLKQQIASKLKVPVVATYQFNRESAKKKKGEQVTRDDVYGSDAIAQLSTIMLGLLESDTIEQEQARKISVLKGRNGESGEFRVRWDFNNMNFEEIVKYSPEDHEGQGHEQEMMYLD